MKMVHVNVVDHQLEIVLVGMPLTPAEYEVKTDKEKEATFENSK